ncbi:tetraacyldisaccharide 4'-kinase [Oricola sp.]|uniref:tetraacyldisaccharide 4'-kinase n=1 Tax=Oricola sp. TaxID=1979950 RepID=UPI003BAB8002
MAGHEAPPFWYEAPGWQTYVLAPASLIYGAVAGFRMDHHRPPTVDAPVLCIGNLTVGGSGKTPTAIAFAETARQAGYKPGFLTRGYGGSLATTHSVDPEHDSARTVGDEPLLLARAAPTMVARNRAQGATELVAAGIDFIIMDDGFQSRGVHYDYALIAVDSRRGIGNGAVIPAGPLRAPMVLQMRHADAVLRVGNGDAADPVVRAAARAAKPVYLAELVSREPETVLGRPLLAYAGIGDPEKFFDGLRALGREIPETRGFADHHEFTEDDASALLEAATAAGLQLVTTEKDFVRLDRSEGPLAELQRSTRPVGVDLRFESPTDMAVIIERVVARFEERRIFGGR